MTKKYMTTKEKAKQLGMSFQGLEKAIKYDRIRPDAKIGKIKGFEEHTTITPSKKKRSI